MSKASIAGTLVLMMLASPHSFAAEGHCAVSEKVVFSCAVGKKIVSVCSSSAGIQYRYGAIGALELKYPAVKPTLYDGVLYQGNLAFSAGGAEYARFINNDYEYIVYSGQGQGWEQDGLMVVKAGKVISRKACAALPVSNFAELGREGVELDGDDVASEVWELVQAE